MAEDLEQRLRDEVSGLSDAAIHIVNVGELLDILDALSTSRARSEALERVGRQMANALHNLEQAFSFGKDKPLVDRLVREWERRPLPQARGQR